MSSDHDRDATRSDEEDDGFRYEDAGEQPSERSREGSESADVIGVGEDGAASGTGEDSNEVSQESPEEDAEPHVETHASVPEESEAQEFSMERTDVNGESEAQDNDTEQQHSNEENEAQDPNKEQAQSNGESNDSQSESSSGDDDEEEINTDARKATEDNQSPDDNELLERQLKFMLDSNMLSNQEFKDLSKRDKIAAIVNFLNSNESTMMPNAPLFTTEGPQALARGNAIATSDPRFVKETSVKVPDSGGINEKRIYGPRPDLANPMTPEEHERYTKYLRGENKITEMHNIPLKSRLFIGNLPLKNVTKEDLFRIFSPYGHILQINIKNAFGFIQYDNPQSVLNAIECESQELNFSKKLILEISSSNARPQYDHGDHGTNSSSTFISSSKRPFQQLSGEERADMYSEEVISKKPKRHVPNCLIYVKRTADRSYANDVFRKFRHSTELDTDMIFLKPRMELNKLLSDAAYDGVWGVILINRTHNVDVQTFYKGSQNETKFDEYVSVSCDDAIAIFNSLKTRRLGGSAPSGPGPTNIYSGQNSVPMATPYGMPPQQPQHQPQQQPQQQQMMGSYYSGYGVPQTAPQHSQGYMSGAHQGSYNSMSNQGYPMNYDQYQTGGVNSNSNAPPHTQPLGASINQGYDSRYQNAAPGLMSNTMGVAAHNNAALNPNNGGSNANGMDQQQLLSAIQNLPPNVVSQLLSAAQQQQQQPNAHQQLIGMIQSMQPQNNVSSPSPSNTSRMASMQPGPNSGYINPPNHMAVQGSSQIQQPATDEKESAGNKVQSLLDSLAKLQK